VTNKGENCEQCIPSVAEQFEITFFSIAVVVASVGALVLVIGTRGRLGFPKAEIDAQDMFQ
jgi:hypothetical protein